MDPVLFWNDIAMEVHRRDFTVGRLGDAFAAGDPAMFEEGGPTATSRAFAMVHVGIYNAVAAVAGRPTYGGPPGANFVVPAYTGTANSTVARDVAVAAVASSLLNRLFPSQEAYVNGRAAAFLAPIGPVSADFIAGRNFGWHLALAIWTWREGDGHLRGDATIAPQTREAHRPDPFDPRQEALGPAWGRVTKFCIPVAGFDLSNYLAPYPAVGGADYRQASREVEVLGSGVTAERSDDQTVAGIYWGYDGAEGLGTPPRLFNQAVRAAIDGMGLSVEEHARLFALVHCGMADAGIIAWDGKYTYNLWRPVVGIPIENGLQPGPAAWAPLGMPRTNQDKLNLTPAFPAYPSGHATFGAAAFGLLALFLADRAGTPVKNSETFQAALEATPFELVSDEFNGVNRDPRDGKPRPFRRRRFTLAEAIVENALSRVYLGVHWRFDGLSDKAAPEGLKLDVVNELNVKIGGVAVGLKIAQDMYPNFFEQAAPDRRAG